jgi:hypothetical protein
MTISDGVRAEMTSEPDKVGGYIDVYGVSVRFRVDGSERTVLLLATGLEMMQAGLAGNESDRAAWLRYVARARAFVAGTYESLDDLPEQLELGALLRH